MKQNTASFIDKLVTIHRNTDRTDMP